MEFYFILSNFLVIVHMLFIIFVVWGGIIVVRHPRVAFLHLPACAWGAWIEYSGGVCPLTPWENRFRLLAGDRGYEGDFIEHYLLPIIYPERLTGEIQFLLGSFVVVINAFFYGLAVYRRRKKARSIV
ncbi:MAG TPA: DUF2784 domain-containing protein [Syntrophales bacterium]|nr:DUF2784 domain-containing protein [Syntrophales bacterium]HOL59839.1 DUF2784 domain-containing protein [Syntrophales bacterium]HPO35943.1 DUF2784 domain-containing protein [Syntrophales bacterium]